MAEPITSTQSSNYFYKPADTLRDAIERLTASVKGLYSSWISALSMTEMIERVEFANRTLTILNNFPVVYEKDMGKTVEKVESLIQKSLMQIDQMVHAWKIGSKEFDTQKQMEELALAIKMLPFLRDRSIFTGVSSVFISPFVKKTQINIECTGSFPTTTDSRLMPTLVLKDREFKCVKTKGHLSFSVPYSFLFSIDNQPFTALEFTVKIPYVAGKGWFSNTIAHVAYKGWLSLLPDSPGRIILEYVTTREEEERKLLSQSYIQSSKDAVEGESQSIIDRPHILAAEAGWSLIKGSSRLSILNNQGKGNSWALTSEEPQKITYQVTTHKEPINDKDSGRLDFEITAVMTRTLPVFEQKREEYNLKWGDSITIDPSKKEWKVIFSAFDGTRYEHVSDGDNPFLSIKSTDGIPTLSIKTPKIIKTATPQPNPLIDTLLAKL